MSKTDGVSYERWRRKNLAIANRSRAAAHTICRGDLEISL